MEKERELPIYNLHGTDFYVDVNKLLLSEAGDLGNKLFIRDMDDNGSFYEFEYDKREKCIVMPDFHMCEQIEDIVNATLPPLGQLDPERMAQKYGYEVAQIKGMSDQQIFGNQPGLKDRLSGALPEIELLPGHIFVVDWKHRYLLIKDDNEHGILHFSNMLKTKDETAYLCAYHIPSHSEYKYEAGDSSIPKDVIILEIPYELKLDPVAVALEYKVDINKTVRVFPVQKELRANRVRLSKEQASGIFELFRKKQEEQSQNKGLKM
ncbi:hypothetical protein [Sphingobacterium detergens]|uniref:Uncharacterized protein n=1 Tax=Sphingobacterium detergens TaxID=1145106 RepID=A0A420ARR4_SPHD1|nr:hypothetical protein [Sphingobacterium detergens]RKE47174.1 hypothetical protein DFQ12_4338 [Sphingobacterium detergens]